MAPGEGHVGLAIEERALNRSGPPESSPCPLDTPGSSDRTFAYPCVYDGEVLAVFCVHWSGPVGRADPEWLTDTADQVARFEARARTEHQTRRNEAHKAAMLESTLDAVITVDHRGRIIEFNPAAVRIFGWQAEEVIGEPGEMLVPASRKQRFEQLVERVARMRQVDGVKGERIEGIAVRKGGEQFPVEVTVTRVDAGGAPTFVAYLRDLSAAKQAERERESLLIAERSARLAAEDARSRTSFLAGAGRLLSSSLDLDETLRKLAGLVVPWLADWFAIDLLQPGGEIETVAIEHPDPAELAWAYEFRKAYPPLLSDPEGIARVIRTGESILAEVIDEDHLSLAARDDRHLEELRRLAPASAMIVPLSAGRSPIGAMTMISTSPQRRYGPEDLELAEEFARHAGLAIDNARLYAEKNYIATTLQRGLLPRRLPEVPGLELAARYRPGGSAFEVGGDFYDVFALDDGRCFLAVGDVEGKGPEAASSTGLVRHTLRAAARYEEDPGRLLEVVNRAMIEDDSGLLCSLALALITPGASGSFADIACGGHPRPAVLRAGRPIEAVCQIGTVLGVFDDPLSVTTRHVLGLGDSLVIFSDGLLGRGGDPMAVLESCRLDPGWGADHIADGLLAAAPNERPDRSPDDVCVLVAKLTGPASPLPRL